MLDSSKQCILCKDKLVNNTIDPDVGVYFECERCGGYHFDNQALATWNSAYKDNPMAGARLSHTVFTMSRGPGHWVRISADLLAAILTEPIELPLPAEQLDNLVLWLGTMQRDAGSWIDEPKQAIAAIGALGDSGLGFIATEAANGGLISGAPIATNTLASKLFAFMPMQLTMFGWSKFAELRREKSSSNIAFMAMPFGHPELDDLFRDRLVPAVEKTGFRLKRLDEEQPAGLIDDRLRVEIRQCRFLIADLTHGNPGAYWEAGFAEGLGKDVIYTCRKDVFDDKKAAPHFDTNHHLTVVWDPRHLDDATHKLKATIRATLPDTAVLSD
jgi:hypothetical protein